MTERQSSKVNPTNPKAEDSFKGTLFSVGVVGAVIVIVWVAVFWIYMARV
ncbi:cytochrome c oxidase subunit 2A [Halobacillus sp. Marseille-Q1614]|nr:cytochrome c oxidase subunit 2A [Halobacillus sp. Marseille-Q1614]